MKKQAVLKTIANGLIILVVTVLTYKFIMWNFWKVEQAVTQAKKILAAPPAINLTLSKNNQVLFQKSFAYNSQGNYYIINHFDISPYIGENLAFTMSVNRQHTNSLWLYRFEHFNIIGFQHYHFVFTTPHCGIEEFIKLKDSMPVIIDSLSKLAGNDNKAQPEDNIMKEFIEAKVVVNRSSK
ncbi:MAG: hypothetical protein PVH61_01065 [Candidatus Aminicenantes bacterium]|jgi:hypothetical protein